jgi:hypothetical protein
MGRNDKIVLGLTRRDVNFAKPGFFVEGQSPNQPIAGSQLGRLCAK